MNGWQKYLKNFEKQNKKKRKNFYKKALRNFWCEYKTDCEGDTYLLITSKRKLYTYLFCNWEEFYRYGIEKILKTNNDYPLPVFKRVLKTA